MANRVTADEVREILETDLTDTQLDAFITTAHLLIERYIIDDDDCDLNETDDADLLKEIERWLSAHLACVRDARLKSEKIGDAEDTYSRGPLGMGLQATEYGQHVLLLDTCGALADANSRKKKMVFAAV